MIRICHFSDPHLPVTAGETMRALARGFSAKRLAGAANLFLRRGGAYRDAERKFAAFLDYLATERFDALLFTGDFSSLGMPEEFARFRAALSPLLGGPAPLVFTPGNHDLYVARDLPTFRAAFADLLPGGGEGAPAAGDPLERVAELEIGHVSLVSFNSSCPNGNPLVSRGRVAEPTLAALRARSRRPGRAGRIALFATHYGTSGPDGRKERFRGLSNAADLESLLDATPGALLCHGHTHRPFAGRTRGGTPVFCAGSLTREGAESFLVHEFDGMRLSVRAGLYRDGRYVLSDRTLDRHAFAPA